MKIAPVAGKLVPQMLFSAALRDTFHFHLSRNMSHVTSQKVSGFELFRCVPAGVRVELQIEIARFLGYLRRLHLVEGRTILSDQNKSAIGSEVRNHVYTSFMLKIGLKLDLLGFFQFVWIKENVGVRILSGLNF